MKMNNKPFLFGLLVALLFVLQGCDLILDIFNFGVWVGIIISAIVVFLLIWIIYTIWKKISK